MFQNDNTSPKWLEEKARPPELSCFSLLGNLFTYQVKLFVSVVVFIPTSQYVFSTVAAFILKEVTCLQIFSAKTVYTSACHTLHACALLSLF
jgi:hypothetical protein